MTGATFGTVIVLPQDEKGETFDVEVTTYRSEEDYVGGRWPSKVEFTSSIEEDLERRDFTVNALALDLTQEKELKLIDLFSGSDDLQKKIIRAVGNPKERFSEDGLRGFRGCRLASQLEFTIEEKTFKAISETLDIAEKVSMERVRDELMKLLMNSPKPSVGLRLLKDSGLLKLFIPELLEGVGITQPEWHADDVFDHSMKTVDLAEDSIKVAALFHDIGKVRTKTEDKKGTHFYKHDIKGAEMTKEILKRLRFSKAEVERVEKLIRWHMFYYPSADWRKEKDLVKMSEEELKEERNKRLRMGWTDAAVRRFIVSVGGEDAIDDLMKLRIADANANPKTTFHPIEIEALEKRISEVRAKEMALKVGDLDINGKDLAKLGIEKGPKMGEILQNLLDKVIEDPGLNRKETLLEEARKLVLSP